MAGHVRPAHTVVVQSCRLHLCGTEEITAIHHYRITQERFDAVKVQSGEVFPLGQYQACVGAGHGGIRVLGKLHAAGNKLFCRASHGRGIVCRDGASFFQQGLDNGDGWRLTNVVRAVLEGQTKYCQLFPFERPQRLIHFAQEADALFFIDFDGFVEQTKAAAVVASDRAKGEQVFGEAGASIADAWEKEAAADAGVAANAFAYLLHVRAYGLAHRGNCVDERYLHGQERV